MTEYDYDNLDDEQSDFISDDLDILSDYYDLMKEDGLTKSEFDKYKAQCISRLKTKNYIPTSDHDVSALKFAHSLHKSGCLTKEEYEMVKKRIEQLSQKEIELTISSNNDYKLKYKSSPKDIETRGTKLFAELKDLFKSKKKGLIDEEKYLSEKEIIIEKIVNSNDTLQSDTYKYASELSLIGAITSDDYERIIQDSMNDRLINAPSNKAEEKRLRDFQLYIEQEEAENKTQEETERKDRLAYCWELLKFILVNLWELFKLLFYIFSIPFRIVFWFLEIGAVGYENVWKRDEMERIMREKDDD